MTRYLMKINRRSKTLDYATVPKGQQVTRTNKGYKVGEGKPMKGYQLVTAKNKNAAWKKAFNIEVRKKRK